MPSSRRAFAVLLSLCGAAGCASGVASGMGSGGTTSGSSAGPSGSSGSASSGGSSGGASSGGSSGAASCGASGDFAFDCFHRADNASSLGRLDSGQLWSYAPTGSTWGIERDRARLYVAAPGAIEDNYAYLTGVADVTVQLTLAAVGQYSGLTFRFTDPGNCWKLATDTGAGVYFLTKFVNGTQSFPARIAVTPAPGDALQVITQGATIQVVINGILQAQVTDSDNESATGVGLLAGQDLLARFAAFSASGTLSLQAPDAGVSSGGANSSGGSTSGSSSGGSNGGVSSTSGGGTSTGAVDAGYPRLFPASRFDTPLPASPTLDPNSAAFVQSFVTQYTNNYGNVGVQSSENYGQNIYAVPANQPLVKMSVSSGCNDFTVDTGTQIPIPPEAYTTGQGDSPLDIYQPSTDTEWEFWVAAAVADGGGDWTACWGGKISPVSTSNGVFPNPYGVAASGIAYLATDITFADVQAGYIGHALGVTLIGNSCNGSVPPADRTDCGSNPGNPSEGSWFFLPKSVAMPGGLAPLGQMVFHALQTYGMVAMDQGGAVVLARENPSDWTQTGHTGTDPITASYNGQAEWQVVNGLPWSQMQVLAPAPP